ncbi:serine/threonine protein phosphatase [bacterium]|nr:serine/threonine protein phosphatase [bacterium]
MSQAARTLAIGDIHGCDSALETLLSTLNVTAQDTVITLGDVVDRGPNTRRVIEQLLQLASQCRLITIRGNHEEMMLKVLHGNPWRAGWLNCGCWEVLESYGGELEAIPQEHRQFLEAMQSYWETEHDIFVHAGVDPNVDMDQQFDDILRWTSTSAQLPPHKSGKRVICGHTQQRSGLPRLSPGWICIDTAAYSGLWLSALDVEQNELLQANQLGQVRRLQLDAEHIVDITPVSPGTSRDGGTLPGSGPPRV